MYSLDRERLLLFAFKPVDDNVEHLDEQRRLPPTGTQQSPLKRVRTNAITRRIRTSAELEGHRRRVETVVSDVHLDNSVFKKNLFTHYEATVIEVGSVFWRYHAENKDVFVLSDIDVSGELMPSHFVHCEREQLDDTIVYTCSCEAFELMRSNFLLPADNDVEDDEIEGICIHSRFVDKNVACHINSILNGIDTNSSDTALVGKLKTSKTFLNLGVVSLFRSGTVSKFSVLPRDSDAYSLVSILNDTITCHSCLCEVKLYNKRSKKVTLRLDDAARICPHLEAMRAHQEVWVHGAKDGDGEEIGDDETGTDEANIPLSDVPPVEENAPIPRDTRKHFNIQTGLWDFGGFSKHVPAEKNRPSLEQKICERQEIYYRYHNSKYGFADGYITGVVLKPPVPDNSECGAGYKSQQYPEGLSKFDFTTNLYLKHGVAQCLVHYVECNAGCCRLSYTGEEDHIFFWTKETACGDEIGWQFINQVLCGRITFSSFVKYMTDEYRCFKSNSAPFMSKNTFIAWFFSWASAFEIDFRQVIDPFCAHDPKILACIIAMLTQQDNNSR